MTNHVARCVCRSLIGVLWLLAAGVTPALAQERPQALSISTAFEPLRLNARVRSK